MTLSEPGAADVEQGIAELLCAEQVGALATVSPTGAPSVAIMHFASDGLAVYLHTFTDTRKYAAIRRDSRVSYTLAHQPSGGFDARRQLRAVQVSGTATIVTDPAEIDRAIYLSREQFDWLKDSRMYENFRRPGVAQCQVFFRVDPVEALWNDNRVRMLWRKIVTFTPDGRHVADLAPYDVAVG